MPSTAPYNVFPQPIDDPQAILLGGQGKPSLMTGGLTALPEVPDSTKFSMLSPIGAGTGSTSNATGSQGLTGTPADWNGLGTPPGYIGGQMPDGSTPGLPGSNNSGGVDSSGDHRPASLDQQSRLGQSSVYNLNSYGYPDRPAGEEEITQSYSGSDMRVLLEMGNLGRRQLIELTTLTVSVHRAKSPVRACGYINPKGMARGTRTIAGTIILTQFTVDVMYRFLTNPSLRDLSKDSFYVKPDQLPPFNLTLVFADEYGNESFRRLLGVDVLTDGTVYSINDMYTEQTLSYMAADFTPLIPVNRTPKLVLPKGTAAAVQTTPMQVMYEPSAVDSTLSISETVEPVIYESSLMSSTLTPYESVDSSLSYPTI